MADKKITELPNITGADLANADEFAVVDITASQTKAITFGELKTAVGTDFVSKAGSTMTGSLVLNADPTASLQAASKQYVDTIAAAGLHYHDPCRVESSSNLTVTYNNGTAGVGATLTNNSTQVALALDGVTLSSGNRVLVKGQTAQAQNGVYTVTNTGSGSTNWVLTRATDADSYGPSDPDSFGQGDAFFVEEGNTGAGNLDVMNTVGVITFGTTAIVFVNVSASAVYSAGTGVTLTGTQFSIGQAVATGDSPTFAGIDIDNINIDGTTIALSSGDLTLDVAGDIIFDADGGDFRFKDAGTQQFLIDLDTFPNSVILRANTADGDMIFQGNDGGSIITALNLDMSDAGTATFNNDIKLPDNGKAVFGAGSDLEIYHDGSNSYITDAGTGSLLLQGDSLYLMNAAGSSTYFYGNSSTGAAQLRYGNSPKLVTTATGCTVTGSIVADNIGGGSLAPVSPSGTSAVNFTSIPAGVRQVTVMLEQLSLNNNDDLLIQLGDSGGIETSGYISRSVWSVAAESTSGMIIDVNAVGKWTGSMTFTRVHTTNRFVQTHTVVDPDQNEQRVGAGSKTLSGELTQLRVVPTGSNTFDNGSVSIAWSY